jgi:hypothetical protein
MVIVVLLVLNRGHKEPGMPPAALQEFSIE